jgi:multiple sugar transport system substrate-binding protein
LRLAGATSALTKRLLLQRAAGAAAVLGSSVWSAACGAGGQESAKPVGKLPPVVVWASNTGQADLPYFERFAKWFEEANPGTKVDLVLPPGEGSYEAKMIAMFAGGTYPDVFHLHFSRLREFWFKGTLQPFDQYIKSSKAPIDDFIPGVMVPFKIKGQTWGLPRDNATGVMYYNKELFLAAGAKEPDANWQWDRLWKEFPST